MGDIRMVIFKRQGIAGWIGDLLLILPLIPRLLEWTLELRFIRVGLGMANLGQAVDFAIQHLENPGWLGNGWMQFAAIVIGLILIFWDRKRPTWLPSPELNSRQMIIGGLVIILIGAALVAAGLWQGQPAESSVSGTQLQPQVQAPPQPAAAPAPTPTPALVQPSFRTNADREGISVALSDLSKILNTQATPTFDLANKFYIESGLDGGGTDLPQFPLEKDVIISKLQAIADGAQTTFTEIYNKWLPNVSESIKEELGVVVGPGGARPEQPVYNFFQNTLGLIGDIRGVAAINKTGDKFTSLGVFAYRAREWQQANNAFGAWIGQTRGRSVQLSKSIK
jgi:hypothetical protein